MEREIHVAKRGHKSARHMFAPVVVTQTALKHEQTRLRA